MTDPINRLRAADNSTDNTFNAQEGHTRMNTLIEGQAPGISTRRRRTIIGGAITGGVACTGLAFGLILGTGGPGSAGTEVPAIAITDGVVGNGSATQVQPAAWYAEQSVEALDGIDVSNLILQMDRTDSGFSADEATQVTEILAGDGTGTVYADQSGRTEIRTLTDADGTMDYTWLDKDAGVYTVFPWGPENYVDDEMPTVQVQVQQQVADLRGQVEGLEAREKADSVWEVAEGEATEIDGVSVIRVDYTFGPEVPEDEMLPEVVSGTESVYYDATTNVPVRIESTSTLEFNDGVPTTISSTVSYRWFDATPENRQMLVPNTEGLRQVDEATFDELAN